MQISSSRALPANLCRCTGEEFRVEDFLQLSLLRRCRSGVPGVTAPGIEPSTLPALVVNSSSVLTAEARSCSEIFSKLRC
jgi:hypothetical protein